MPQDVYISEIELKVSILEAAGPTGLGPFPKLTQTGSTEIRTFEALVLENEWLEASFVPDLGGHLLRLVDKTSGRQVLDNELSFAESGPRGVHAFGGLEWTLNGEPRENALGRVRTLTDEDGVWFAEAVAGNGLSYHLHVSLHESTIHCEVRIRNRTLYPVPWNPGLLWSPKLAGYAIGSTVLAHSDARGSGFAVIPDKKSRMTSKPGGATYFEKARPLAPRWGDTFNFAIVPVFGQGRPLALSTTAALGLAGDDLVLNSFSTVEDAKLVMQNAQGQTLEAPVNLVPGASVRYRLDELGGMPMGFAVLDSKRNEVLRYPTETNIDNLEQESYPYPAALPDSIDLFETEPATRYWTLHIQTQRALQEKRFAEAEHLAEAALLYNGDDPLAWIEKSVAARLAGDENPDSPDLPNAHFLAPLEPLLRAEGFLAQTGLDGKAFLGPLGESPNELIEVACRYVELQLFEDAARFIDAALTVARLPMLLYLYAYCCIATDKLHADAASAVAGVTAFEPPFPWRPIERQVLFKLAQNFPNNAILSQYLGVFEP